MPYSTSMAVIFTVKNYLWRFSFYISLLLFCELPETSQKQVFDCQLNVTSEDGTQFYDLSSLSRKNWKVKSPGESNISLQYAFISLCGNVKEPPCSDSQTRICVRKEGKDNNWSDVISNAGSIIQKLELNKTEDSKNGRLTLELEGQPCGDLNYTTIINLECSDEIGEPIILPNKEKCRLHVHWPTVAACPIVNASTKSCVLSLPHNWGSFNLWPLRHVLYYQIPNGSDVAFRINVCDTVKSGCGNASSEAAACKIDAKTNRTIAITGLKSRQTLKYSEKGITTLIYKVPNEKITTEIQFVCNPNTLYGEPKYKWEDNKTYTFELETSLACIASPLDCTAYDSRNYKYDLKALSKKKSNWIVSDSKDENVKYHINVCRPLNPSSNCAGGAVSVCQTNTSKDATQTFLSLGVLSPGPEIVGNDYQLSMNYNDGSPCDDKFRRRTVINFKCSNNEGFPVFKNMSPDCVYTFEWSHPAACPLKISIGQNCTVREPVFSHLFNLNSIYNPHRDYEMHLANNATFRINICGPLLQSCSGQKNVSVCYKKDNTEFAIGELSTNLSYEEGRLSLKLPGQGCKKGVNSSEVHVIFFCKHNETESLPELFPAAEGNCTFYVLWQSNLACPPHIEFSCRTKGDNGEEYDLSKLSDPNGNYVVLHNTSNGYIKFILNVCRSVVFGDGALCEHKSGICLNNKTKTSNENNFLNLGDAEELQYKNGTLQLNYGQGSLCHEGHVSSTIVFKCGQEKKPDPKFMKLDGCRYHFEWHTIYACSSRVLSLMKHSIQEEKDEDCSVNDPITHVKYDLGSLANKEYTVSSPNGDIFHFAVCGSVKMCDTANRVGSCQQKGEMFVNAGLGNSNLQYKPGSLFLNYSNGENCMPGRNISTLIEFVCSQENKIPPAEYVDNPSNCSHVIKWFTELACERNASCKTVGNGMDKPVDLSPFINTKNNYRTTVNGSHFFINVCHPLITVPGLHCGGGSAACMAQEDNSLMWIEEKSLGISQRYGPVLDGKNVILKYLHGDVCGDEMNYSTSLNFTCDPNAGLGSPVHTTLTSDCQYQFLWKSSILCDDYESKLQNSCVLHNDQTNLKINITSLKREGGGYEVDDYEMDLCSNGSIATLSQQVNGKKLSYGKVQSVVFRYSKNVTTLIFSGGEKCTSGSSGDTYSAELNFKCAQDAVDEKPKASNVTNCKVVFDWRTPVACAGYIPPEPHDQGGLVNSGNHVSTAGVVVALLMVFIIVGLVVMFFRKPANRSWCRSHLCCFVNRRHQGQFHYSKLEASDEASILLANHSEGVDSDSDDELLRT